MRPTIRAGGPTGLAVVLILAAAAAAVARDGIEQRSYETRRVAGEVLRLDGRLDDPAWDLVAWAGEFTQRAPQDGAPPSRQTGFKVLYDDRALYFAVRAFDDPALLSPRLARRDWFPGDWVEVNIDSRADERTAYSFTLSLSGTRGDEYISDDGNNWDGNWDPIWEGATAVDGEGWTAELRIPLSQLRFDPGQGRPWGLQVTRKIFREGETSNWQRIPQDTRGWVSNFGDLVGLGDLASGSRAEVLPYVVLQTERYGAVADDPFRDGVDGRATAGLDAKLGLSNDVSLDLTVNPDFGQVEADPSEVNLTAFESFFAEKRPFFIEGADVLNLPLAPATTGGAFTRDVLFYSRRIGRSPSHTPRLAGGERADAPEQTSILGAAKLTGKTAGGLSLGILESVTARERADVAGPQGRRTETVEPLTSYFVGRVSQDLRAGQTVVGGMLTSVIRDIDEPYLAFLERQAWAGGVDLQHYFRDRDYKLEVRLLGSHLRGSETAITGAQTSSARYFQRPDNRHAHVDSSRTTLGGHAGSVMLARTGNETNLMYQVGGAWRSPGFEINDLGFMRSADEINQFGWIGYVRRQPFGIMNRWQVNANEWVDWDFGGAPLRRAVNVNTNGQLRSQHGFYAGATRSFASISNTALRGGPSSRWPGAWEAEVNFYTDERRPLRAELGGWAGLGDEDSYRLGHAYAALTYQPTHNLRLSCQPWFERRRDEMQYVQTVAAPGGERYLFGRIDQRTAGLTFRLDLCLTPALTVQYYGAPFLSAGRFDALKRITAPRADAFGDRFQEFGPGEIATTADGYAIDEDADGAVDYTLADPDFDVRDFHSNLVLRWEWDPGSTLYLVWSQGRDSFGGEGSFGLGDDLEALFATHPEDVFLIKINRWFAI